MTSGRIQATYRVELIDWSVGLRRVVVGRLIGEGKRILNEIAGVVWIARIDVILSRLDLPQTRSTVATRRARSPAPLVIVERLGCFKRLVVRLPMMIHTDSFRVRVQITLDRVQALFGLNRTPFSN